MEINLDLYGTIFEFIDSYLIIVVLSTYCFVRMLFISPFFKKQVANISYYFLGFGTFLTLLYQSYHEMMQYGRIGIFSVIVYCLIQGPLISFLAWIVYITERFVRGIIESKKK